MTPKPPRLRAETYPASENRNIRRAGTLRIAQQETRDAWPDVPEENRAYSGGSPPPATWSPRHPCNAIAQREPHPDSRNAVPIFITRPPDNPLFETIPDLYCTHEQPPCQEHASGTRSHPCRLAVALSSAVSLRNVANSIKKGPFSQQTRIVSPVSTERNCGNYVF